MRISDVEKITGIPLATLKDLRHRSILALASPSYSDDPEEIRKWGSFSVPSVMILMAAKQVRKSYGLSWSDAVNFSKLSLNKVNVRHENGILKFFDLRALEHEIWVGRFDFKGLSETNHGYSDSNYFAVTLQDLPQALDAALEHSNHPENLKNNNSGAITAQDFSSCIMLNASQLCREFFEKAHSVGALRNFDDR